MFLQPLKHNSRKDFFFFFHRLPILHLPFPSQPCGHKGSSISVNRIKCSIDPASHSILQDTPSTGLNKAPKTPQPDHRSPIESGYPPIFCKEDASFTCPNCLYYLCVTDRGHLVAGLFFEPDTETFILENFNINILLH